MITRLNKLNFAYKEFTADKIRAGTENFSGHCRIKCSGDLQITNVYRARINQTTVAVKLYGFGIKQVSQEELDIKMRVGYGRSLFESLLPLVLGHDVSGEVAAVGAFVRTLNVGQEVFGALHPTAVRGTYAADAVLAEDQLTPKPSRISHVEASAIPFATLTAWHALKSTARITKGINGEDLVLSVLSLDTPLFMIYAPISSKTLTADERVIDILACITPSCETNGGNQSNSSFTSCCLIKPHNNL